MSAETHTTLASKPDKVAIFIDGTKYQARAHALTGQQIRALAQPPVGEDRDLWLDIVDELDRLIDDDEVVDLIERMRFFTVPRVINPGQRGGRRTAVAR